MNAEINCSQRNMLISTIIMECPVDKVNMAAVSAKRSMVETSDRGADGRRGLSCSSSSSSSS